MIKTAAAFAALLVLTYSCAAYGQEKDKNRDIEKTVTATGMTVIAQEYRDDLAAACVFVKVGSAYETAANNGISSLLGRALLSCHPAGEEKPSALKIEQLGGQVSFKTESEFTCFTLVAPLRNFGDALKVLAEALGSPECSEASVRTEKEALFASVDRGEDSPVGRAFRMFMEKAWEGSPYALGPDGDKAAISRLKVEDLVYWHRKYYVADNMVLSICGRLDSKAALKVAQGAFAGFGRGKGETKSCGAAPAISKTASSELDTPMPAGGSVAVLGYDAPGLSSPDYAAMKVVEAALCGGMGSSIYSGLRDEQGLAYSFGSAMPPMRSGSKLAFYVAGDKDNIDAAVAVVKRSVELLKAGSIMPEEVERAKGYARGEYGMGRELAGDRAWNAGLYETIGLGADFGTRLEKQMDGIGKSEMVMAANKYLDKYTLVVLKPGRGGRF
jgi:zinc protease